MISKHRAAGRHRNSQDSTGGRGLTVVLGVCFLSEVPGLLKIENPLRLYGENGKKGSSNADSQSRDPSQFQVQLPFLGSVPEGI